MGKSLRELNTLEYFTGVKKDDALYMLDLSETIDTHVLINSKKEYRIRSYVSMATVYSIDLLQLT